MDSFNSNLNLLDADSCEICGTLTCDCLPYRDNLREYYEILDLQDDLTNKQKMFQLYRHCTRIFHEVLKIRFREQLPAYPKEEIERRFPYRVGEIRIGFCSVD